MSERQAPHPHAGWKSILSFPENNYSSKQRFVFLRLKASGVTSFEGNISPKTAIRFAYVFTQQKSFVNLDVRGLWNLIERRFEGQSVFLKTGSRIFFFLFLK